MRCDRAELLQRLVRTLATLNFGHQQHSVGNFFGTLCSLHILNVQISIEPGDSWICREFDIHYAKLVCLSTALQPNASLLFRQDPTKYHNSTSHLAGDACFIRTLSLFSKMKKILLR